MNRTYIVVLVGLFLAVHVSVGSVPAPVPILLAFGSVISVLLFLIWETAHQGAPRRRRSTSPWALN